MSKLLLDKKVIITGASSGIGKAAVQEAVNEGAQVVAIGRNEEKLKELQELTKCHYIVGDLTKPEECKRMVDEAAVLMGGISTLVNCAGVLKGGALGSDAANLDNFQFNFTNNTQSVWSMMEHAIPHLKKNIDEDGASIVNISSVNGLQSFGGVAAYCAAKAAVDMLSRCAAIDLAPFKIRVNSICPGVVATELQKRGGLTDDAYTAFVERSKTVTHPLAIPRGEIAQPQDVANLIVFLASDKAKWITGDNIKIDGGRSAMGAR
jgi:NAD(P)-dependent dehydrogenase (short-subunit alcohol dehydrogenase family)